MTTHAFPWLGELLRTIVVTAGYRRRIEEIDLGKDLDDLAGDSRPGSACDLMAKVERACLEAIEMDCGAAWARCLGSAWHDTRRTVQQMVLCVDTGPLDDQDGHAAVQKAFVIPMLARFLRSAASQRPGPALAAWCDSPVATWLRHAEAETGTDGNDREKRLHDMEERLHDDPRTTARWLAGQPIRRLRWPFRTAVTRAIGKEAEERISTDGVARLAGWLTISVAFQSLSAEMRARIREEYESGSLQPWSPSEAARRLNAHAFSAGDRPVRAAAVPLLQRTEHLFTVRPRDSGAIRACLAEFQALIEQETEFWQRTYQHLHDWFSARLAALEGHEAQARDLYKAAVEGVWWYGGPNQHPIIDEALLYAVGMDERVAAGHHWDRTFMLGLNKWPKRLLDDQERRRLALAFERRFAPLKATDRVPPPMEFIVRDGPFALTRDQLAHPNRKVKHAEGRIRRTPLMDAIREGTPADVEQALQAGGDPDDYIKESGEGPLSYAMRRACDRKDPAVMDLLLRLELLPQTVNRPASTGRETPLKLAIEMANAGAVARLVDLGARIEDRCGGQPSALCYAMLLLHGSIHRQDSTQEQAYMTGKTPADAYDAKDGVALDVDLAARRQAQRALREATAENAELFETVRNHFIQPAAECREVVRTLLGKGADANRRYKVEAHLPDEWTPTLFAAQVGDLEVLKALIDGGGDPKLTLRPTASSVERLDALWIAVGYQRGAVIDCLKRQL